MIFGFAENYLKILIKVKHELILLRSRNDLNAICQTSTTENTSENFRIHINRIDWLMPYVMLSDKRKIQLYHYIKKNIAFSMRFRSWEMYEFSILPSSAKHIWTVTVDQQTSNQLEKPRFIIFGSQTNIKYNNSENVSRCDHCDLKNLKVFWNSQYYPYGNMNTNIAENMCAFFYDMYARFQGVYYLGNGNYTKPFTNRTDLQTYAPVTVIDCLKQKECLKQAAVDVQIKFDLKKNIPNQTAAYCLILHDRIIKYNPISGDLKKIV